MTFAPFSALKARIIADTMRSDQAFGEEIPGFVRLAEARMWYGDEGRRSEGRVRVRDMETSAPVAFVDGAALLPERFLEPIALVWGASEPYFAAPADFWRQEPGGSTLPRCYIIEGQTIRVSPALTGEGRLVYVRSYPPLSLDGDTNWLLVNAPGVYFHGVLFEAYRHLRNAEKQAEADALYRRAAAGVNRTETLARVSPTSLARPRSIFA